MTYADAFKARVLAEIEASRLRKLDEQARAHFFKHKSGRRQNTAPEAVTAILEAFRKDPGAGYKALGRKFNVSDQTIRNILMRNGVRLDKRRTR